MYNKVHTCYSRNETLFMEPQLWDKPIRVRFPSTAALELETEISGGTY